MKAVAVTLTTLLAVLLTASVPAPLETCCRPKAKSCCPPGACRCHVSLPAKPQPVSETPAVAVDVVLYHPESSERLGPDSSQILRFAQNDMRTRPTSLFALTHAFLI